MKRRDFIKVTGLGAVGATAVAAPAIAQSMPEIKWRMPTSWPKSLDTLYGGAEMMTKMVAEATDNKFQIQPFAGGEIVPGLQVLDAVQAGTVEIGHTASYYYFGKDPTFAFGSSIPFGPNMRLNQAWYMLGGGKQVLDEFMNAHLLTVRGRPRRPNHLHCLCDACVGILRLISPERHDSFERIPCKKGRSDDACAANLSVRKVECSSHRVPKSL